MSDFPLEREDVSSDNFDDNEDMFNCFLVCMINFFRTTRYNLLDDNQMHFELKGEKELYVCSQMIFV